MKFFIFILSMSFAVPLLAADQERQIISLQYFPPPNIWHSNASFIYQGLGSGPASLYNSNLTSMATNFVLGRSVGSVFDFSLQQAYYLSNKQDVSYGPLSGKNGQNETYNSSGLNDLSLNAQARPLEAKGLGGTIIGDLFLTYSPSVIEAKTPSVTKTGTVGRGGSSVKYGLRYGHKWSAFEIMLAFSQDAQSDRTSTDLSNNQLITSTGGNTQNYTLAGQFNFSDFFQLGIIYDTFGIDKKIDRGTTTVTTLGYVYSNLDFQFNFRFNNSFLLQLAGGGQASTVNAPIIISSTTYTNFLNIYHFGLNAIAQF